ncbi:YopX family protein [uncultured Leuconostoc sp.]|uniref:YopX family protein n=1 Tax=uncultured Leuconostoc sp. TaxID=173262 RepID=UPI0025999EF8|nr:YopX family protein [uncultured Leuconostoc sp.]
MREIKFRVWDNEENNFWGEGRNLSLVSLVSDSVVNDDSTVLEQYTGLKDKNGVEIYEGDIVQYGEDRDFIFVVIFKYGCFYAHNILGEKFMTDSLLGSLVMSEKVSVIGNIHENADLLEK